MSGAKHVHRFNDELKVPGRNVNLARALLDTPEAAPTLVFEFLSEQSRAGSRPSRDAKALETLSTRFMPNRLGGSPEKGKGAELLPPVVDLAKSLLAPCNSSELALKFLGSNLRQSDPSSDELIALQLLLNRYDSVPLGELSKRFKVSIQDNSAQHPDGYWIGTREVSLVIPEGCDFKATRGEVSRANTSKWLDENSALLPAFKESDLQRFENSAF